MNSIVHYAGIAAYLFAAASILSTLALIVMFAGVGVFGPINDVISALQFLFLVPVAIASYQTLRPMNPVMTAISTVVGVLAMLIFAALQLSLVAGILRFDQTLGAVLAAGAVIGLWLIAADATLLMGGHVATWLGWTGIVGGISFVLTAVGWFFLGGIDHPAVTVGFIVGAILLPVWGFGLGRVLSGPLMPS